MASGRGKFPTWDAAVFVWTLGAPAKRLRKDSFSIAVKDNAHLRLLVEEAEKEKEKKMSDERQNGGRLAAGGGVTCIAGIAGIAGRPKTGTPRSSRPLCPLDAPGLHPLYSLMSQHSCQRHPLVLNNTPHQSLTTPLTCTHLAFSLSNTWRVPTLFPAHPCAISPCPYIIHPCILHNVSGPHPMQGVKKLKLHVFARPGQSSGRLGEEGDRAEGLELVQVTDALLDAVCRLLLLS